MAKPLFSPEELAELAAADAEIDESFAQTNEERIASRRRDRAAVLQRMDPAKRKIAEAQKAYREANKDKIKVYMREYMRKRRMQRCRESSV